MPLFRPALTVFGLVSFILAALLVVPAAVAYWVDSENSLAFLYSCLIACAVGALSFIAGGREIRRIAPRQMFVVTGVNWFGVSLISALPFMLGSSELSFVDALFEATSGVTTTGSTVMAGLDEQADDILLWRSLTQWLGGLGIIGMAVAIFPYLRVGGMRLFQTESSDWTETSSSRVRQVAWNVVRSYLILSLLCAATYLLLGMSWFDAINHAMTTISTGGYSTSDSSFGAFHSMPLLWACSFFMLAGAVPFVLYYQSLRTRSILIFRDQQVKGLLLVLLTLSLGTIFVRTLSGEHEHYFSMLSHTVFNVVSVVTTTGYASEDYATWGAAVALIFFCATFLGGCSGSTSGGVKIFRFQLLALLWREHTIKSVHPLATVQRHYNNRPVSEAILVSTVAYLFVVLISLAIFSVALAVTGLDLTTSLTGAATALMNVGPGLGDVIGPSGNFSELNAPAKLLLCVAMLLGRLEFVTLLVFFSSAYWKW